MAATDEHVDLELSTVGNTSPKASLTNPTKSFAKARCPPIVHTKPFQAGVGIAVAIAFTVSLIIGLVFGLRSPVWGYFGNEEQMVNHFSLGWREGFDWVIWNAGFGKRSWDGCHEIAYAVMYAADSGSSTKKPSHSTTNNQVEGVDEADWVKTDGTYIYSLNNQQTNSTDTGYGYGYGQCRQTLNIVRAYPVASASIMWSHMLDESFVAFAILLEESSNMLAVMGERVFERSQDVQREFVEIQVFDITNRANPTFVRSIAIEGWHIGARLSNGVLYEIVGFSPIQAINGELTRVMPFCVDSLASKSACTAVTEVGHVNTINAQSMISIVALDLKRPLTPLGKAMAAVKGSVVYVSRNSIYLATSDYLTTSSADTVIAKFDIAGTKIAFRGVRRVRGTVLNQFSLDEHPTTGYFRIATTSFISGITSSSSSFLYVFDERFELVGELGNIAPGERIYSARFDDNRAYLVTFKNTDPLFTIDLSQPRQPRIAGELKVPGVSDYLHPIDDTHVIGVGRNQPDPTQSILKDVKISLFDVSDPEAPKEAATVVITWDSPTETDGYISSPVKDDHKSFFYSHSKNLLAVPVDKRSYKSFMEDSQFGTYLYSITPQYTFALQARIDHYDEAKYSSDEFYYAANLNYYTGFLIRRHFYIENNFYTISNNQIYVNSIENYGLLAKLYIANRNSTIDPLTVELHH